MTLTLITWLEVAFARVLIVKLTFYSFFIYSFIYYFHTMLWKKSHAQSTLKEWRALFHLRLHKLFGFLLHRKYQYFHLLKIFIEFSSESTRAQFVLFKRNNFWTTFSPYYTVVFWDAQYFLIQTYKLYFQRKSCTLFPCN